MKTSSRDTLRRRSAGWLALFAALVLAAAPATAAGPAIALTFDDLPAHGPLPANETRLTVAQAILATLDAHHVGQAYGFVTGSFGHGDPIAPDVLRAWRAAGHPLGNHSWSHPNLDATDPATYTADIARNEATVAPLMEGADWHWFRYPFLSEGTDPTRHRAVRAFLHKQGYRVASVTLNFDDWRYNEPYARCLAKGDGAAVAALEVDWLAAAKASFNRSRAQAQAVTGHDIPYVLLLHVGAFTAHMLPRLLDLYEAADARFVPLAAAEADPFYAGDTRHVARGVSVSLDEAAQRSGKTTPNAVSSALDLIAMCG